MSAFSYLMIISSVACVTTVNSLWGYTLKDVIASCDRLGGAGWCTKIMGTYEKAIYAIYGESKNPLCFEDPIERCTCIEMLFRTTTLSPSFPNIDKEDVAKYFRRSSNKYHPQNTNRGDQPFLFLQKCAEAFSIPFLREEYIKRIKPRLEDCFDDSIPDAKCRKGIIRRHKKFFGEYKEFKKYSKKNDDINKNGPNLTPLLTQRKPLEKLYIYIDDSGSMSGSGCKKGHEFIESIQNRLIDTPSDIHFIGSKATVEQQKANYGSRLLINNSMELTEENIKSYVLDKWTGGSGGTYLWEYIWESMKNESAKDCEILIITDGGDNESKGEFYGIEGFNKLMTNIKQSNGVLCRVFVYCVSNDCKQEVRKTSKDQATYIDLAWVTGGFYCDDENVEDCNEILTATHYTRTRMANVTKGEHLKLIADGKAKMLGFEEKDSSLLKMINAEKEEL